MDDDFDRVFLSDRYVKYGVFRRELSAEESGVQRALLLQQRLVENCLVRASIIGVSSAFIGGLVGAFFFTIQANHTAHSVSADEPSALRSQLRAQYRQLVPVVKGAARNFAKLGFIYSLFECVIQKRRARSDLRNSIYAGCASGTLLGLKNGPIASAGGCIGFAAFSGLVEKYQQSHH